MPRHAARRVCALLLAGLAIALVAAPRAAVAPAPLAIGAEAPDFTLPGVDGKSYSLASFAKNPVLVVMFTAVHCPTAEVYEARMKQLVADYQPRASPSPSSSRTAPRRFGSTRWATPTWATRSTT